jgi:hypothetical protein
MPGVISFQPAGVLACRWRFNALTVRRTRQPKRINPSTLVRAERTFVACQRHSVEGRNQAPEARHFVGGERHNVVDAGCETLADEQATRCIDEANPGNCIADHISNRGSTSRPARSATAAECRDPAMSDHRVLPRQRRPFLISRSRRPCSTSTVRRLPLYHADVVSEGVS